MPVEIVPLTPDRFDAVRRFSERTWTRPTSDAYYRWRYAECPSLTGYVALRDGECAAMLTGFARPYRVGGRVVDVHESFDWFCLPELRRSGLGVRVLQRAMADPAPITVIGGTEDTRNLLPRLGFQIPGALRSFVLPLGGRRAAEVLERRARIPAPLTRAAFAVARPILFAPRRRRAPDGARAVPVATAGEELPALYADAVHASMPMWRLDHLRWISSGFPAFGAFTLLYFLRGETLLGFSLLRAGREGAGIVARIVDVFAPAPDVELFAWMLAETLALAAAYRPDFVSAQTTSPELAAALRKCRFRENAALPIHWWSRSREPLPEPLFFGGHWGDAPLLPYPTWWFPGAGERR